MEVLGQSNKIILDGAIGMLGDVRTIGLIVGLYCLLMPVLTPPTSWYIVI